MQNRFSSLIFFLGFTFFFVVSVVFSYITWEDYVQSKDKPWPGFDCEVKNTEEEECETADSVRLLANVTEFQVGNEFPKPHFEEEQLITAFWTADEAACLKRETVEEYKTMLQEKKNETKCYSNGQSVRLQPGGDAEWIVANYRLRAIFPIIAAIISGLTLCYAIYHVAVVYRSARTRRAGASDRAPRSYDYDAYNAGIRRYGSRTASDELSIERPPRAGHRNGHRRPISGHDARLLITALKEERRPGRRNNQERFGPCAICLEDVESGESSSHVSLPCHHAYHEDCISQWFRKGSGSCPYCNHDLTDFIHTLREEAAESRLMDKGRRQLNISERERGVEDTTSSDSGGLRAESTQAAENGTGAVAPSNPEQESSSYWSWGWLGRQMSST